MIDALQEISLILGIVIGSSTIVNFLIIKPLRLEMKSLGEAIIEAKESILRLTDSNRTLEIKFNTIETQHYEHERRISKLEERMFK